VERGRPEALVEVKGQFEFFEDTVLGDGRTWVLGEEGPGLADIEGGRFLFHCSGTSGIWIGVYLCNKRADFLV